MRIRGKEYLQKRRLPVIISIFFATSILSSCQEGEQITLDNSPTPLPSSTAFPYPSPITPSSLPIVSPKTTAEPKPRVDAKDFYTKNKPTLMGLSLNESKETVTRKFGPVPKQWVMDADIEPITVWVYTDFSIGFNNKDELVFVEVHSKEIDPGLGGLRLGLGADSAYKALGKPTSSNTNTLLYKSQGTVLKIDVDPKQNEVLGIHFFKSIS